MKDLIEDIEKDIHRYLISIKKIVKKFALRL